jgi:hypothetical protein
MDSSSVNIPCIFRTSHPNFGMLFDTARHLHVLIIKKTKSIKEINIIDPGAAKNNQ